MTAGHCALISPLNSQGFVDFYQKGWYSPPTYRYIGPLEYNSYAPYDFGLIRQIGTNVTLSTIISNLDHPTLYPLLFVKNVAVINSVGTSLCISGHHSHVICGEVIELNVVTLAKHPISNLNFTKREMIRTDIKCGPGDSGGIVFYYYYALQIPYALVVGTVIGGNGDDCIFLPIPVSFRAARLDFNLNLTVVYTPQQMSY
ncbi:serine protease [Gigaspora margarita]|uniref:Serine protease n=1 Tax=Gigaspora margarita TaxID=4874 RepID=A0A8H3X5S3_GIGMA|nr:serine protease [Gigaspora margarita]